MDLTRNLILALALATTLLTSCKKESTYTVDPVTVTTEVAGTSATNLSRTYVGTIEESAATSISFNANGTIKSIVVSEGQSVSKGQLLAMLDDTQARNMLAMSEAGMHQAEDALARMKKLHDQGTLPDLKWVEVESQVAQAAAQLEIARKNVADCAIYAPVSGVVGKKLMSEGETAMPSRPVLSILNIDEVKVRVSIPEKEIGRITATTPTAFSVEALGGRTYKGGKIEKGVAADELTHTYDIRIAAANADRQLMPGMVAKVQLTTGSGSEEPQAITLPLRAVQQSADGQYFVWVVTGGKAHRQGVEIGSTTGNRICILSGVEEGEKVIVSGYHKVSEGKEVTE